MKKKINVQIIKNKGRAEWAVIPYTYYLRLHRLAKLDAVSDEQEELIPEEYAERLISGENPIKVWREYRQLTQKTLAKAVKISVPYLSQLENSERTASIAVLKKIAKTLKLSLDDLAN